MASTTPLFLVTLLFALSCVQSTVIWTADFSSTTAIQSQWSISGTYADSSSNSLRLRASAYVYRTVSTVGYTAITVNFQSKAQSLESGDYCYADYSTNGGTSWTSLTTLVNGQDNLQWYPFSLNPGPPGDNDASFMIRFGIHAGTTGDYCYVQSLTVSGNAGPPTPPVPPTPTPPSPTPGPTPTPTSCDYDCLSGTGSVTRTLLPYSVLVGNVVPTSAVDTSAFVVPSNAANPSNNFQGSFTLAPSTPTTAKWTEVRDDYNYVSPANPQAGQIPSDITYTFVQYGTHIIPTIRGNQRSTHPYWEMVLAPGRVWDETSDNGYSRVAFPFTLTQRNANCALNGVMMFLFKSNGAKSNVYYQVGQETCMYFKINMWGLLASSLSLGSVPGASTYQSNYATERSNFMTRRAVADLPTYLPGVDVSTFGDGVTPADLTNVGAIVDGVHYMDLGTNAARFGPYPFPDFLVLPSYSTAKLLHLSAMTMRFEQKYPSVGLLDQVVSSLVPACSRYSSVTLNYAQNMGTGWYDSSVYLTDESSTKEENSFFLPTTHSAKINFACTGWGKRTNSGVNSTWVYHTSDHYLIATALQAAINTAEPSTGGIKGFWQNEFVTPLKLSALVADIRVTYDATAQPWGAWGLFYYPDDVAKLSNFLNAGEGKIGGTTWLSQTRLATALQRTPNGGGLTPNVSPNPDNYEYRYRLAAWAKNVYKGTVHNTNCGANFCPFVYGYGGIEVILLPNKMVYYYFSDNAEAEWTDATLSLSDARSPCTVTY